MKLLREVNTRRNVIEFIDQFDNHLVVLESRVAVLLEEMKATERYQRAEAARLAAEAAKIESGDVAGANVIRRRGCAAADHKKRPAP
jgi:hypothetical protein